MKKKEKFYQHHFIWYIDKNPQKLKSVDKFFLLFFQTFRTKVLNSVLIGSGSVGSTRFGLPGPGPGKYSRPG